MKKRNNNNVDTASEPDLKKDSVVSVLKVHVPAMSLAAWVQAIAAVIVAFAAVWMTGQVNAIRAEQVATRLVVQSGAEGVLRDRESAMVLHTKLLEAEERQSRMLRLICRNYAESARERQACEAP